MTLEDDFSFLIKTKNGTSYFHLFLNEKDDFIKLQFIRELDLSKNKLKSLPKNFGCMANLKNLDLLGNELTALPASFCELKSLQVQM
jgi:Leucine-rich repeat (LRR) protein